MTEGAGFGPAVLSQLESFLAGVMAAKRKSKQMHIRMHNVVPDSIDLRDRPYIPSVMVIPAEVLAPKVNIPVLNQRDTNACTESP